MKWKTHKSLLRFLSRFEPEHTEEEFEQLISC